MCGRIKRTENKRIAFECGFEPFDEKPIYNGAPMQFFEVIYRDFIGTLAVKRMQWGLYGSAGMINARAETLDKKAAFKSLLNRQRCIFPIDGFYEWQKAPKQPFLISMKDDAPFALACLWAEWMTPQTVTDTFTVVTTAANSLIQAAHDRMPVILDSNAIKIWLSDLPFKEVSDLLKPFSAEKMKMQPVGNAVNYVKNRGAECATPLLGPVSLFD